MLKRAIERPMTNPSVVGLWGSQVADSTSSFDRSWTSGMTVPKLSISRKTVIKMAVSGFLPDMIFSL